jgi:spore coat protein U-like protein
VFDFGIGGTLHVNANQTPGIYRGTVTVTVTYN